MADYQIITNMTEYMDALAQFQRDIPQYIQNVGGLRTKVTVRLPKPLTDLVVRRGDVSYGFVSKKLTATLGQFCEIGEWFKGKDEKGHDYIQFKLIPPERVRDGD